MSCRVFDSTTDKLSLKQVVISFIKTVTRASRASEKKRGGLRDDLDQKYSEGLEARDPGLT